MVKIKEGYVMSAKEREEYERQNALPRKASGRVDYYFKPQTKYPPRIYVFMDAELWRDRNRRPMGLHTAYPFLSRPMNKEEIEYHHFNWRLCYHQYEDWNKLIYAEEKEAEELEQEEPGKGIAFLNKLKACREKFPLNAAVGKFPPVPPEVPADEETVYLRELIESGDALNAAEVSRLLDDEQSGEKRPAVLFALRQLYQNCVQPATERQTLDEQRIKRKVVLQADRTRRNFVRRVYNKNKLFALEEIRYKYPGYTEAMLAKDLQRRERPAKCKKRKPVTDLRQCQLQKLAHRLRYGVLDEKDYHNTCCKMVILQNAHNQRLPIPLTVKLQGETLVYSFGWRIREGVVKEFVTLANSPEMTHNALQERYEQMVQSNYSY